MNVQHKRILLLDDTDALQSLVGASNAACEVVTARDGEEASRAFGGRVDGVLVNPRRSVPGVEVFIRGLAERRLGIPVVLAWEAGDLQRALLA